MPTLTIRNVPNKIVNSLKRLARANGRSMEQQIRMMLAEQVGDRGSVLRQLEEMWQRQARRPAADEVQRWISESRP